MLLHFYDRQTFRAALTMPLAPELHDLLANRIARFEAEGLLDMTEIVVVDANTTERELIAAVGFTPLIDTDGCRFGERDFCPTLDYVCCVSAHYHEVIHCVGNSGFAFHLLIHDGADPALVALCRAFAEFTE
jgi:hypothetical protein